MLSKRSDAASVNISRRMLRRHSNLGSSSRCMAQKKRIAQRNEARNPSSRRSPTGRPSCLESRRPIGSCRNSFVSLKSRAGDPDKAFRLGSEWIDGPNVPEKRKGEKNAFLNNMAEMRKNTALPAGLTAALFGRMVTSDTDANITAPVHVAHAFTVHEEETESDYFTAVDDLSGEEPGADTIQETELTSGLFYGYVVVDLPGLLLNLGADAELARQVLHNLIYLIAEVSPGAKLGSTAPYGRASFMLLEAGDRQPRSLAEAYRTPCDPHASQAVEALAAHLAALDEIYATGEDRRVMSLANIEVPEAAHGSLAALADWAKTLPKAAVS